ncbi:hypothetical protein GJ496_011873 [Pomphorhynchus laevis]|nr:hypothetical protein GJ496_011873 [Pomphorhynchus laevis]
MGATESRNERFYQCCGLGKAHLVDRMLESDKMYKTINVDWVSFETKSTPLLIASANGHDKVVDILLKHNANPNLTDSHEYTSLHHAAQRGYSEIIKKLVNAKCDVNAIDHQGWTALMKACYWCQPDAVMVLLHCGANIHICNCSSRNALHELCRSPIAGREADLAEIAMALIEAGCELDERATTEGELTPLMYAAYHNHLDVALVLIESDSDLFATDQQGWTALHWACDRNNPDIVQLLLDKGSPKLVECNAGMTPVMRAKSNTVREMFAYGRRSNSRSSSNSGISENDSGNLLVLNNNGQIPKQQNDMSNNQLSKEFCLQSNREKDNEGIAENIALVRNEQNWNKSIVVEDIICIAPSTSTTAAIPDLSR